MTDGGREPAALSTPLRGLHEALGARMVTFAGYAMPLQYPAGIIGEHVHTRTYASLFDVSHMGQVRIAGGRAPARLESLMPIDVIDLAPGRQRYGFLTNGEGGILDDLIVANMGEFLLVVLNAATKAQDVAHVRGALAESCTLDVLDDRALLALQGPAAARVMGRHAPQTRSMRFMDVIQTRLAGVECYISRSGYTGEDGFEVSVPGAAAEQIARRLLDEHEVSPAGLGARDSLRLEAGLCLYGQDLDASTSPVEAGLAWALSKARRPGGTRPGGYPGADAIERQLEGGVARKRVALLPQSRLPVRAGCVLDDGAGNRVGTVTSGGFGPTLGAPVAMGYVDTSAAAPGTALEAVVRDRRVAVHVAAPPVVPHRYVRG